MSESSHRRVVVTGIGLVTPLGPDRETTWRNLLAGKSGLCRLPDDHLAGLPHRGTIPPGLTAGGPAPPLTLDASRRTGEPNIDLALQAADEALADAGITLTAHDPIRAGIVFGNSKGGLHSVQTFRQRPAAAAWMNYFPDSPALRLSAEYNFRAAALCPVAACATGLLAVQRGAELIRDDICDVVLSGSSDASLLPLVQGCFHRLGVLAASFDDTAAACRPFDESRDGFLVGEGAAVLVLEEENSARARGRTPYAEWLGGGLVSDATSLTQLEPDAPALAHLLAHLPVQCRFDWSEVGYLNLHGTGTVMNDACESAAIHRAIGSTAEVIPASSLKGSLGHLLGAAGSVETALTLIALRRGVLPPNRNLQHPFPGCRLNLIRQPLETNVNVAVKLSLGFGGHLAAAAFRRA